MLYNLAYTDTNYCTQYSVPVELASLLCNCNNFGTFLLIVVPTTLRVHYANLSFSFFMRRFRCEWATVSLSVVVLLGTSKPHE